MRSRSAQRPPGASPPGAGAGALPGAPQRSSAYPLSEAPGTESVGVRRLRIHNPSTAFPSNSACQGLIPACAGARCGRPVHHPCGWFARTLPHRHRRRVAALPTSMALTSNREPVLEEPVLRGSLGHPCLLGFGGWRGPDAPELWGGGCRSWLRRLGSTAAVSAAFSTAVHARCNQPHACSASIFKCHCMPYCTTSIGSILLHWAQGSNRLFPTCLGPRGIARGA